MGDEDIEALVSEDSYTPVDGVLRLKQNVTREAWLGGGSRACLRCGPGVTILAPNPETLEELAKQLQYLAQRVRCAMAEKGFTEQVLGVLEDFLSDELFNHRESMEGNTGTIQNSDGALWIGLDDGRTFRLTVSEEVG